MQESVEGDIQVCYSQIALAEIVHGLVEGKAHINMAQAGVPYRMRQRAADLSGLVRNWISVNDYQEAREGYASLVPQLEKLLGVDFWAISDGQAVRDVLALVERILGSVYFDVMDAWLYAEGLIAQVQSILTDDRYFADTVNMISNPSGNVHDEDQRRMWSNSLCATMSETALPKELESCIIRGQRRRTSVSTTARCVIATQQQSSCV